MPVRGANSNTHRPPQKKAGGLGDPTPETRQAGPPTTLALATRIDTVWVLVPAPPPSRQFPNKHPLHRDLPGLVRRARTYPWWETTGAFFSPQTPSGLGDDRAPTRLLSWDAKRPPVATGASLGSKALGPHSLGSKALRKQISPSFVYLTALPCQPTLGRPGTCTTMAVAPTLDRERRPDTQIALICRVARDIQEASAATDPPDLANG